MAELGACRRHAPKREGLQLMSGEKVIRFRDYERKSSDADAVERDPTDCIIIILPVIRAERHEEERHVQEAR
jgi:hypothetical protein